MELKLWCYFINIRAYNHGKHTIIWCFATQKVKKSISHDPCFKDSCGKKLPQRASKIESFIPLPVEGNNKVLHNTKSAVTMKEKKLRLTAAYTVRLLRNNAWTQSSMY